MTNRNFKDYDEDIKKFIENNPLVRGMQENLLLKLDITDEEMRKYCYSFDCIVVEFSKKKLVLATELVDVIYKMDAPERVKLYFAIKAVDIIQERKMMEKLGEEIRRMKTSKEKQDE